MKEDKKLIRCLLTFFFGWIGSLVINCTEVKPEGWRSNTVAYFFLGIISLGIYKYVASFFNLVFDETKESNVGYIKE